MLESLNSVAPAQCVCFAPGECDGCVCMDSERALRAWGYGGAPMPAMTPQQRKECIEEAVYMDEGTNREDFAGLSDSDLAKAVLHAMTVYCRDKGLL